MMALVLKLVVTLVIVCQGQCLYPVLLVPGIVSSQMQARYVKSPPHPICGDTHKWFRLWMNPKYVLPISDIFDCLTQTIKLNYDNKSRTTSSPDFCEVNAPGFGTVDTISYLTEPKIVISAYFVGIIKELVSKFGYVANKDILGAPYDFRKGPNEMGPFLADVKTLVEKMWADNGGRPVVLIAHSLGNLHVTRLLNAVSQEWKDKYVKTFIGLGPPYSGSMKAVQALFTGFKMPIPFVKAIAFRELLVTLPSNYYLLPNAQMWSDEVIVVTKERNYTARNLVELLRRSKIEHAVEHFEDVTANVAVPQAPNVSMHCIYSTNVSTVSALDYSGQLFPSGTPQFLYGDGDGSVNLQSLKICGQWKKDQTHTVEEHIIQNVNHFAIMNNRAAIDIISAIMGKILRD